MGRRCVAPYPTRPTRPHEHSHCRAKPTRTVRVHCEHILMWSPCTGRTRRSGPVPSNGWVVRPTVHATDYNKVMLYACLPGKGKQPVPARLRASANRANNPLQLTGSNKFNPRASINISNRPFIELIRKSLYCMPMYSCISS